MSSALSQHFGKVRRSCCFCVDHYCRTDYPRRRDVVEACRGFMALVPFMQVKFLRKPGREWRFCGLFSGLHRGGLLIDV